MQSRVIVYTFDGRKEFRRVPNGLQPVDYDKGILIGPPDLHDLNLDEDKSLELNNALVDAGFADYKSLNGRRADLLKLIQSVLGLSLKEAMQVRYNLLVIYTKEFYPEKFEGLWLHQQRKA